MKRFINISFLSLVFAGMALTGCNDDLTTSSYVKVNDEDVLGNVSQLEKVLTSAYKQLYFNTDKGDRFSVYGYDGEFIGTAKKDTENNLLKIEKNFF